MSVLKSLVVTMALSALCTTAGCAGHNALLVSRLYFGQSSPLGLITDQQFESFVDTAITPRFPDGLTRYAANGQWKNGKGDVVKEPSTVVEIIHPARAEYQDKLQVIIESYKRAYRQESVLLVQGRQKVAF